MKKYINEDLIKIIISLILFIMSFFLSNNLSVIVIVIGYILVSYEMYLESFKSIKELDFFTEDTLMILATLGAFYIGCYEEAIMVMILFQFGEYLSDLAVEKSKKSISELMDLRVDIVNLLVDGKTKKVNIQEVKVGEVFKVLPGERVPLDGIIIDGSSAVDTSAITGEVVPRTIRVNDKILSGFINRDSVITVKSTSTYSTTTTTRILDLIENVSDKKSKTEKFITKFARIYTPIVVLIAILLVIIPTLFGGYFDEWLYRGLTFLVTSCPCALVLSVPLGYFCGIGVASRNGAIMKGSNELDNLCDIDYLLLDKTGTITEGIFEVVKIYSIDRSEEELLSIVASAEENSIHPIALAIKNKYTDKLLPVRNYKEIEGMGITCSVNKKDVLIGNKKLLNEHNIKCSESKEMGTTIYVAIDKEYAGYIVISDKVKEVNKNISLLKGVIKKDIIILSGDNSKNVKEVAETIGISSFYGELLPQDKVSKVMEYKEKGKVMFMGDGINDAPVIKISDVGVSMGNIGSDAAIEASDIVLMSDNINTIEKIINISRVTKRKVKQSILFALIVKFIILILSVLGMTSIWVAVFADVGVTLLSVLNVLTIFWRKY